MSDRTDRALDALKTVDPETLRALQTHLPDAAPLLADLAAALDAKPEAQPAALEAAMGAVDPAKLLERLRGRLAETSTALDDVRRGLARADDRLARGRHLRARLAEMVEPLVDAAADDPSLHALMAEARAAVLDETPWRAAAQIRDAVGSLVDALGVGLRDGQPTFDPKAVADLHRRLSAAEAEVNRLPARMAAVLDVLERARALADRIEHPLRAPLALIVARVTPVLRPDTPHDPLWRQALDRTLAAQDLGGALEAGRQVQAAALAGGDFRTAAVVSHRIAELARTVDALDVEVIARLEQAQSAAREPQFAAKARALADDAMIGARAVGGAKLARARLMYGQLLDHLGDSETARNVWRRLMRAGKEPGSIDPGILGRAALALGRSELAVGHTSRARLNLQLAHDLAVEHGDARLYDAALPALLEVLEAVDRDAAAERFAAAEAHVGPQASRLRTALAARFGASTVQRWMAVGEAAR